MSNLDRRFAIIIGINNYDVSPLRYCVPDAQGVAKVLESHCAFKKEDIITIISDDDHPVKDISGYLDNAYRYVEREAQPQMDSIFFYFAGHGVYQSEQSGLQFHDNLVQVKSIFDRFNSLNLKYQCYMIDACESGGKVLTRGNTGSRFIEDLISNSSGILFMYAATESEMASEDPALGHGLFTHYFLEAIGNKALYDEYGILTTNRIHDFIARETATESKFKQNPVIENRAVGYYPFAFTTSSTATTESTSSERLYIENKTAISSEIAIVDEESQATASATSIVDQLYFPTIPVSIREQVQAALKEMLNQVVINTANDFRQNGYEVTIGEALSAFPHEADEKITNSIVEQANKAGIEAVNQIFTFQQRERPVQLGGSWLNSFMHTSASEPSVDKVIHWYDDKNISAYSLYLHSSDIHKVSGGLVIIVYQALYGLGVASSCFFREFTGYEDAGVNGLTTTLKAFKVHAQTLDNVKQEVISTVINFTDKLTRWDKLRQQKIEQFDSKAE